MLRKAMLYLGLGPDEEYEDYEEPQAATSAPRAGTDRTPDNVRALPTTGSSAAEDVAVKRPVVPTTVKPRVVVPTSFNHAQEVGDRLKEHVPVIMNLQGVDRDLSRRLIDFASGVCYALGGHMERVAQSVYLILPTDVEVSDEDRRRLSARGYDS